MFLRHISIYLQLHSGSQPRRKPNTYTRKKRFGTSDTCDILALHLALCLTRHLNNINAFRSVYFMFQFHVITNIQGIGNYTFNLIHL